MKMMNFSPIFPLSLEPVLVDYKDITSKHNYNTLEGDEA